jgi:hypothetical protein
MCLKESFSVKCSSINVVTKQKSKAIFPGVFETPVLSQTLLEATLSAILDFQSTIISGWFTAYIALLWSTIAFG